jgi:hypothetical protein
LNVLSHAGLGFVLFLVRWVSVSFAGQKKRAGTRPTLSQGGNAISGTRLITWRSHRRKTASWRAPRSKGRDLRGISERCSPA